MRTEYLLLLILSYHFFPQFGVAASAPALHSIDEHLEGPASIYTDPLISLLRRWPRPRGFCHADSQPLQAQTIGIRTSGRPYYVGFKKCMVIQAPLEAVASVLDDTAHFKDLFPGFETVKEVFRDKNKFVLAWERRIPVFFVPNIHYEISYLREQPSPDRLTYRYQFKSGDRIKFNDGIEVLERKGTSSTLFTNYEFYEADYGLGILGIDVVDADRVWKESLEGSYDSIFSIRLRAEHPDWSYGKIEKEREKLLKTIPFEKVGYENGLGGG